MGGWKDRPLEDQMGFDLFLLGGAEVQEKITSWVLVHWLWIASETSKWGWVGDVDCVGLELRRVAF